MRAKKTSAEEIAKIDAALWAIHEVVMRETDGKSGEMWRHFNTLKTQAVLIKALLVR